MTDRQLCIHPSANSHPSKPLVILWWDHSLMSSVCITTSLLSASFEFHIPKPIYLVTVSIILERTLENYLALRYVYPNKPTMYSPYLMLYFERGEFLKIFVILNWGTGYLGRISGFNYRPICLLWTVSYSSLTWFVKEEYI